MALRLSGLCLAVAACGCIQPTMTPKKDQIPMEQVTLQNLLRMPDGREYLVGTGHGSPVYGEKNVELRRKVAREEASTEAQRKLIAQLKNLPAERVRRLLRQAEVAQMEYGYDDACTVTLRIPKEALQTESKNQWDGN